MIDKTRYSLLSTFFNGLLIGVLVSLFVIIGTLPFGLKKMQKKFIQKTINRIGINFYSEFSMGPKFFPQDYKGIMSGDVSHQLYPSLMGRFPFQAWAYSLERFKQVKVGMTEFQVIDLLGEPIRKEKDYFDENLIIWKYATYVVSAHECFQRDIQFKNGKVVKVVLYTSNSM